MKKQLFICIHNGEILHGFDSYDSALEFFESYKTQFNKPDDEIFRIVRTDATLSDPEPLDPYTCELMVGDEVFIYGSKHIVISITPRCANAPILYELIDIRPNSVYLGRYKSILITKRKLLKLLHRNGATIKEVGNE